MKHNQKTKAFSTGSPVKSEDSESAHLLALFHNAPIGMVICNPDGRFINVNEKFTEITGYSKEELYSMTFREITYPDDLEEDLKLFNQLLQGHRRSFQMEKRYVTKKKEIVWVNLLVSAALNSLNEPEKIIGTIEEIADKKQILQELEKSKTDYKNALKLLQSIQDAIPDLIGVQDLHHNIIQYNQAGYKMLNKTYNEVAGRKCYSLIGRVDQCEVCSTAEAIRTGKPARHEQYFPELDTWLDMRAYPIFDENNEMIYIVEHLRDITDIKKLELQLKETIRNLNEAKLKAEESDNLKTAFLHNISHEIKTPLNGIIGFSDLLKNEGLDCDTIKEYSDIIINSGWKLSSIINDLVSIATIESGQAKENIGKVDIHSLLKTINSNFQAKAAAKGIDFYFRSDLQELQYICTDETKLFEIISNILNNAVKFTNAGYIELGVSIVDNKLQFFVKDTGIGIRKEDHEKIFIRFAQANLNPDKLYGGSGLGLAISKAYVELLGGTIWLESEPGKGSTFYFNIPLKTDNNSFKNNSDNGLRKTKHTVLVAEDDLINYRYFAESVKDLDIKLLHARNGSEAVEIFKQEPETGLIFMDIKMPVMNGHEATRLIKLIDPEIPIIAVSAYFEDEEKEISRRMGCIDYLEKPVKKEVIIDRIQKFVLNKKAKV